MAFTAFLDTVLVQDDRVMAYVTYTDGVSRKFNEQVQIDRLTAEGFRARIAARVTELDGNAALLNALKTGPIDLTPLPIGLLTPAEVARRAFAALFDKRQRLQQAVTAGLLATTDPIITAVDTELKATFKPEYFGG